MYVEYFYQLQCISHMYALIQPNHNIIFKHGKLKKANHFFVTKWNCNADKWSLLNHLPYIYIYVIQYLWLRAKPTKLDMYHVAWGRIHVFHKLPVVSIWCCHRIKNKPGSIYIIIIVRQNIIHVRTCSILI